MDPMEDVLGLGLSPPGLNFDPDDDELVEQYLLRQILGQQLPLDDVIIEDDPLSASPWELLKKHELEDDAFFFANGQTRHETGNRQKRTCVDGCWEGQKTRLERLRVKDSGTEITWKKYMLNFHRTGKKGSTGWVMHEYSITDPEDLASSSLRLYRIRLTGYGQNSSLRGSGDDGGAAQARADEEHNSAANSVFPMVAAVDLVDDEGGGSARPAPTSYSDQVYQNQPPNATYDYDWTHLDSFQGLAGPNNLGDYAGPGSHEYFMGGNTMDLGTHSATPSSDQGATPGVMNEYGAAPAAGLLPFGQGSFSGDEPFMDFELSDDLHDFNVDDFLVFPDDPCSGLESPINDQYFSAGMQMQSFHDR